MAATLLAADANEQTSKYGLYCFAFHRNNRIVKVLVDDRLPYDPRSKALAFAGASKTQTLWAPLLEKAYAKLCRSYEAIEGGFTNQALTDLTGGISKTITLAKVASQDALWQQLREYKQSGFLLGAGTPAGADTVDGASPSGIVQGV